MTVRFRTEGSLGTAARVSAGPRTGIEHGLSFSIRATSIEDRIGQSRLHVGLSTAGGADCRASNDDMGALQATRGEKGAASALFSGSKVSARILATT